MIFQPQMNTARHGRNPSDWTTNGNELTLMKAKNSCPLVPIRGEKFAQLAKAFMHSSTERRSRNRIVLVVVLVIEPRHPIEDEDENEDDEEKFARRAKILRDSSRDSWLILSTTRSLCREYFRVS